MRTSLKVLLSFWILFHLVGIIVMPMPQSILAKQWGPLFKPYLNQLNINTTWNLFSPEPAEPLWMNLSLVSEQYETGVKSLSVPQFQNQVDRNPAHRREYYQMRQMLLNENRVSEFFIPWYCKKFPEVQEIAIEVYRALRPGLEQAYLDPRHSVQELTEIKMVKEFRQSCLQDSP